MKKFLSEFHTETNDKSWTKQNNIYNTIDFDKTKAPDDHLYDGQKKFDKSSYNFALIMTLELVQKLQSITNDL